MQNVTIHHYLQAILFNPKIGKRAVLTRSLREPGGACTKSMEVSESRMERVNGTIKSYQLLQRMNPLLPCVYSSSQSGHHLHL